MGAGALEWPRARDAVLGFVAVSPPLSQLASLSLGSLALWGSLARRRGDCPLLVLHGRRDSFASAADVERHTDAVRAGAAAGQVEVRDSADHFWVGSEPWLAGRARAWLARMPP